MTAGRGIIWRKRRNFRPTLKGQPKITLDGPSSTQTASRNSPLCLIWKYMGLTHKNKVTQHHIILWTKLWSIILNISSMSSLDHYGGFKVLKSSLVASFSILTSLLPSLCMIMLHWLSFLSMLGPLFLSNINTSDLGSIICSCIWETVPGNESTW